MKLTFGSICYGEKWIGIMQWQGRHSSAILDEVVREVLSQKGTFEGAPEGSEGGTMWTT